MKRKRTSFSKLLLLLESAIVLYTTYQGFGIAKLAIELGFMGTLPWIATMVTAAWGAYGTSAACYYAKAKAENTAGGFLLEFFCLHCPSLHKRLIPDKTPYEVSR